MQSDILTARWLGCGWAQSEFTNMQQVYSLFELWVQAQKGTREREDEAKQVFGDKWLVRGKKRLCYTLAADGKSFHVWHGLPDPDPVDTENHLFAVYGPADMVERFLNDLMTEVDQRKLMEFRSVSGLRLYCDCAF